MQEPRTEQATPRKLARARSRGVVARSPDLSAGAAVLAVAAALLWSGSSLLDALRALLRAGLIGRAAPSASAHRSRRRRARAPTPRSRCSFRCSAAFAGAWLAAWSGRSDVRRGRWRPIAPLHAASGCASVSCGEGASHVTRSSSLDVRSSSCFCSAPPRGAGAERPRPVRAAVGGASGGAVARRGRARPHAAHGRGAACAWPDRSRVPSRAARASARRQARAGRGVAREHGAPEQRERPRRLHDELRVQPRSAACRARGCSGSTARAARSRSPSTQPIQRTCAARGRQGAGHGRPAHAAVAEHNALPVRPHPGLVAALFALELTEACRLRITPLPRKCSVGCRAPIHERLSSIQPAGLRVRRGRGPVRCGARSRIACRSRCAARSRRAVRIAVPFGARKWRLRAR